MLFGKHKIHEWNCGELQMTLIIWEFDLLVSGSQRERLPKRAAARGEPIALLRICSFVVKNTFYGWSAPDTLTF